MSLEVKTSNLQPKKSPESEIETRSKLQLRFRLCEMISRFMSYRDHFSQMTIRIFAQHIGRNKKIGKAKEAAAAIRWYGTPMDAKQPPWPNDIETLTFVLDEWSLCKFDGK